MTINSAERLVPPYVNGVNGTSDEHPSAWVPVVEQPLFHPRKLRVVFIGAGFAGLTFAWKHIYELPDNQNIDLKIYEKNEDVGGTWLENRYPGVTCDVPAHGYTFPFEPNPNWSSFYAGGQEIFDYIKATTKKYNLDESVTFNSRITSTIWNDDKGRWEITIDQHGSTFYDEADILINGSGLLNKWRWPAIKGLHTFKGKLVHSARWDSNIDLSGKRVALIGNGSSAIQILPRIQPTASSIITYIRTPTWISSNFASDLVPEGKNYVYSEEEKQRMRDNPTELFELRKKIEKEVNQIFHIMLADSPIQATLHDLFTKQMKQHWKVGCRRLTPGDGYLEALQENNVRIELGEIDKITSTGITTPTSIEEFDIIICATGFDVSFLPFWEIIGKDGVRLAEQWQDIPQAYMGTCAPNIPNYFQFAGPNAPNGHGSLTIVFDSIIDYIMRWCRKIATEGIKSICVDERATEEYNTYSQEFLKRTVWASGCKSWYKNGKIDGRVTAMYAGSVLHYREMLDSFRTEDFTVEYWSRNRFAFMGNGMTMREAEGGDLAFYLKK